MKYNIILLGLLFIFPSFARAQKDSVTIRNISYVSNSETDAYRQERCKLDIYKPGNGNNYPTVVFFYGGALEMGENIFLKNLKAATLL